MRAFVIVALYFLVLGYILMRGVKPVTEDLKTLYNRIWYGPGKKNKPSKDCLVLHETACTERQVYGKIVSDSIAEHVNHCTKYRILRVKDDLLVIKSHWSDWG